MKISAILYKFEFPNKSSGKKLKLLLILKARMISEFYNKKWSAFFTLKSFVFLKNYKLEFFKFSKIF